MWGNIVGYSAFSLHIVKPRVIFTICILVLQSGFDENNTCRRWSKVGCLNSEKRKKKKKKKKNIGHAVALNRTTREDPIWRLFIKDIQIE
jgi:hypothetical protein